ncbi:MULTISPECIES: hypothetical protein [unclassified Pseudomonas]|uniref:hypothetical protein n=1 Tax=unclassified Pseudomonas TaxID=196821 RepID=UPI00117A292A|nr:MULTISPECIES: hypothetical protein [unclassified Pseudomonas]
MNEKHDPDDRAITLRDVTALTEPLQSAITALAVSIIKLSSVISVMEDEDAQKEGQEAFDNIDGVIADLEQYENVLNELRHGRKVECD